MSRAYEFCTICTRDATSYRDKQQHLYDFVASSARLAHDIAPSSGDLSCWTLSQICSLQYYHLKIMVPQTRKEIASKEEVEESPRDHHYHQGLGCCKKDKFSAVIQVSPEIAGTDPGIFFRGGGSNLPKNFNKQKKKKKKKTHRQKEKGRLGVFSIYSALVWSKSIFAIETIFL